MFYLFIFFLLLLLKLAQVDYSISRKIFFPLILLLLWGLSAFRFEVGCDWSGYLNQYQYQEYFNFSGRDPLWWLLLKTIGRYELGYMWVNVLSSTLCFLGLAVLARRQPDPLGFLVFLFPVFVINMPMSAVRQGIAVGLVCVAMVAFIDKQPKKFVLWLLLAAGFHTSAAIFLVLTPLAVGVATNRRKLIVLAAFAPTLLILVYTASIEIAVERYVGGEREAYGGIFRVTSLLLTGLLFEKFLKKGWLRSRAADYFLVRLGSIGMIGMGGALVISTVIGDRFGYYLLPLQAVIFSRVPFISGIADRAFWSMMPYVLIAVLFCAWVLVSNHFQKCYVPYQSFLWN